MTKLMVREVEGGVIFTAKITPGASRTYIAGLLDGKVKIKIAAAAEKGKANQRLREFLAGQLGVKNRDVRIISGQSQPVKKMQITGISAQELLSKLSPNEKALIND